jgi:GWxTD domain-containing protein
LHRNLKYAKIIDRILEIYEKKHLQQKEFPGSKLRAQALHKPEENQKMKTLKLGSGFVLLILLLINCSGMGKKVHTMPPQDKQFLSEVRYLISKKESKIFRNTPPEERKKFIEEFWKVRDPDPSNEENEFRDEYYRRIEQANHLFREGSQGWLSDRGRIYILLGDPERRDVYPSGYTFYDPPVEIWYYGYFPVIFVDYHREGIYRLEAGSARKLSILNLAQLQLKPQGIARNVRQFDFDLTIQYRAPGEAKLLMDIPYRVTNLFQNQKNKFFETTIKLTVRVTGESGETVLEKEELRPISIPEDMLAQLGKNYSLEFYFQLPPGKYSAQVILENTADKRQARKEIKIKL